MFAHRSHTPITHWVVVVRIHHQVITIWSVPWGGCLDSLCMEWCQSLSAKGNWSFCLDLSLSKVCDVLNYGWLFIKSCYMPLFTAYGTLYVWQRKSVLLLWMKVITDITELCSSWLSSSWLISIILTVCVRSYPTLTLWFCKFCRRNYQKQSASNILKFPLTNIL